jgi:bifunctional UDP-N-acetylglucosamine pyrophosphorylase/glucosamine-1-phosphate N-acetyltransferase
LSGLSAVVFIPDDTAKTGYSRPMMLQNIMGTPLLGWLVSSLIAGGVGRFFLVCHERYKREVRALFPDDVEFLCPTAETTSDQLHVFLSTAEESEEDIIVVTGPAVILPFAADESEFSDAPLVSSVTSVNRKTLMEALDDKFIFTDFLKDHGVPYTDRDGVYAVSGLQELTEWQPVLNRANLTRLARQGVEIWDYGTTYIDPTVSIGVGTAVLPGTILRGQTSIGKNCTIGPNSYLENAKIGDDSVVNASQIYNSTVGYDTRVGPFAYVRPGSNIGNSIKVGDFVEIKNSTVGDGTKISHLTYVGDSDVGRNCNFGCGTVTVNYDRAKKFRTVIEDNAFIGCNTNLVAPVTVGEGAYIAAGSTITDDIPSMALAIARARQQNKKDWASKHKLKEK